MKQKARNESDSFYSIISSDESHLVPTNINTPEAEKIVRQQRRQCEVYKELVLAMDETATPCTAKSKAKKPNKAWGGLHITPTRLEVSESRDASN